MVKFRCIFYAVILAWKIALITFPVSSSAVAKNPLCKSSPALGGSI